MVDASRGAKRTLHAQERRASAPAYAEVRRHVQRCSICGDAGHKKTRHARGRRKVCTSCNRDLPWEAYTLKKRGDDAYPSSRCRECDTANSAVRYRGSVRGRLTILLNAAKGRRFGGFNLTIAHLLELHAKQNGRCYYTGRPMVAEGGPNGISIERLEPSRGYEIGNIVLARWAVNAAKRSLTEADFIQLCEDVLAHRRGASCGVVDAKSRASQAVFRCVHCGHADNADVNAAKEILRRGTAWLGVEAGDARPMKRQSQELQHV